MVRIWVEHLSDGRTEWRGKVQHVLSGEVRFFRDWQVLQQFIKAHLNLGTNDAQPINQEEISPSS